jgi:hypothetical protein
LGYEVLLKRPQPAAVYTFLFVGIGAILIIVFARFRSELKNAIPTLLRYPPYVLFLIFVALVLTAIVIDLRIVRSKALFMVEETLELNAAVALVLCCLCLRSTKLLAES